MVEKVLVLLVVLEVLGEAVEDLPAAQGQQLKIIPECLALILHLSFIVAVVEEEQERLDNGI